MDCTICKRPIVLVPSAVERAKKYGGKPSDYTRAFTTHPHCSIEQRGLEARALMARLAAQEIERKVVVCTAEKCAECPARFTCEGNNGTP
jgi:hypothetical protein